MFLNQIPQLRIDMKNFSSLKKNLKKDFSELPKQKIAVLGDTSTQFLTQAIRGEGYNHNLNLEIWEADFNQIEYQVSDSNSELYNFNPDIILIFLSSHKLLGKYNQLKPGQEIILANREIETIKNICSQIEHNSQAKIIFYNYTEIDDSIFGNYACKLELSFLFQLRKLNYELMCFASQYSNIYICDLSTIQNLIGKANLFQASIYINSEMVLSLDALPLIATKTVDLVRTMAGKIKKCLIIDLDNTTWGGIIGDDGLENIQIGALGIGKAFSEFQYWVKKLKNRGIIIAVCSKNTESIAKEPFEKHPDMVLRLDDISVFIANWENKADNIRHIQQILNIGFDSMVFLDDNPFERNIVRENISQILVPELPEDPAEYLEFLYNLNIFETITFSNEDVERTKLYQIEAQRAIVQQKFTNEEDFLKNLNMNSVIESFNQFNTPRVAQLSMRSNQFNLRTIRYSESEIKALGISINHYTFAFKLADRFGDNGFICVVILQKIDPQILFIDTWFMSCRVLKRGMENFVLNTIVKFAKENNYTQLRGEYLPTEKNEMVKDHYQNLGFSNIDQYWELTISQYEERKCEIKQM
jgi:FkbH-like protein